VSRRDDDGVEVLLPDVDAHPAGLGQMHMLHAAEGEGPGRGVVLLQALYARGVGRDGWGGGRSRGIVCVKAVQ
jgi:hypothetical protein